jgi:hypothetical protein
LISSHVDKVLAFNGDLGISIIWTANWLDMIYHWFLIVEILQSGRE